MLIYTAYITLLAMLILSMSPLFTPFFDLINLSTGLRTVAIQAAGLLVTLIILISKKQHKRCMNELFSLTIAWLPFLGFAAIRTDFGDEYAMVKFGKLFFIPFLSSVTITIVYLSEKGAFNKYFFTVVVLLVAWQLVELLLDPAVFIYATTIERMTVEGINPIWLARSFVTAALCSLMLPIKFRALKLSLVVVFMLAILPTGSRGPLITGVFGLAIYAWVCYRNRPNFNVKVFFSIFALIITLLVSLPILAPKISDYLSRDSEKTVFEESGRLGLFSRAWSDFLSAPVAGVGFGEYGRANRGVTALGNEKGYYPHNIILEVMSELGTIGLITFLLVLRPGKYYFKIRNIYQILFILSLMFAMTSGDIVANAGVMIFGTLARLAHRYPHKLIEIG